MKSNNNIPMQAVNGKLRVPVALLKNVLQADVKIGYGTLSTNSKYIQGIIVTVREQKQGAAL